MSFVGLHIHSDYSLLDGASQITPLVDRAIELGMKAIALTDHGVMYGAIELIKVCNSKGITPIIGNEMYVINGDIEDKTPKKKYKKYHQVVLAKDTQGYQNLVKLTTLSHLKGFQGKGIFARPCINKELLEEYHEGLIVTSACLGGEVPQRILKGDLEEAEKVAKWYKDIFGEDYYLEIQDHGSQEDRIVNIELVKIAKKLDIKIVATNDSHFISCYDVEAHDALLCILTGKKITDEKRLRYSGTEYLKSADEMKLLFRDHLPDEIIEEAINNTLEVADKIKPYDIFGKPRIPDYIVPPGHNADTYLEEITWKGLIERLKCPNRSEVPEVYQKRLETELKVMQVKGFSTYFLVVWDYIKYARDKGIPVGPGRGSAAGSLVAYALKITNIDPVHHGLLFERFLNPERKSMPDVDTDFCIQRRDEMIEYVTEKYGASNVAQIITFNRLTSKSVLKDVGRVLGVSYGDSDRLAKLIPVARGKPAKLKQMTAEDSPDPDFKKAYDSEIVPVHNDKKEIVGEISVRDWIDMAMRIEGTNKTYGVHAAGVVISSQPLDEVVPLQKNNEGSVITQYYMEDLEMLGLLKMDFLGLRNLTTIQKAADLINQYKKVDLDLDDLPLESIKGFNILEKKTAKKLPPDVQETQNLLEKGNLEGIFQLESEGMRQIVKDLKPSGIEDISSILALYRPGPLDAGLIPKFIDRKHGREKVQYQHPILAPILKETYGVIVYQEQIMKIAQEMAGYSLGEADLLRRCLSGSTKVIDADTGSLVTLREIATNPQYWLNKKIYTLNLKTQKIDTGKITAIYPNGIKEVWEITTKSDRKIKATKDHLFYTVLGWQQLQNFQIGDRIGLAKNLSIHSITNVSRSYGLNFQEQDFYFDRDRNKNLAIATGDRELNNILNSEVFWDEIINIEYIGQEEVFDLTIPQHHNFIANDFIAHNCMGKKKLAEMEKQREKFIDGSTKNGVLPEIANGLFDEMVLFAEYCLSYDTKILTVEYGAIPIGKIVEQQIECNVYTVDDNGFIYTQPVVQWHDRGQQEIFEYTLENGNTIKATKDHKFMTNTGEMLPIDEIFHRGLDLKETFIIEH